MPFPCLAPLPSVQVLVAELGPDWQSKVAEFDFQPMAAASIGQVGLGQRRQRRGTSLRGSLHSKGVLTRLHAHGPHAPPSPFPPKQVHSAVLHDGRRAVMKIQVDRGRRKGASPLAPVVLSHT